MGFPEKWDIAGFTDAQSKLGKKVQGGNIRVLPGVALSPDQESLIWPEFVESFKWVKPTRATFGAFVELWEKPPSEILAFARKWGKLGVDKRGVLLGGWHQSRRLQFETRQEPIEAWRYFSRRAYAILGITARLQGGQPGSAEHWAALSPLEKRIDTDLQSVLSQYPHSLMRLAHHDLRRVADANLEAQGLFLNVELVLWMKLSGLGFALGTADEKSLRFKLEIDHNGCLLAAVALQLALTASGFGSVFVCSGCGCIYVRTMKGPKRGDSNYCTTCGRDEAVRQADRRRREKIQDARRLRSEGKSVPEIAKQLGVRSTVTVRRWIQGGK